ncbi:hypothetical protein ALC60_01849 [Trachymyrmex zeteki]|uniref:Uncharacterized protein n=1 Tax=Mycetomoellerius zeteki TaxID=64791 RepID=A0A151XFH4_9HYME|nr:hypothetical protein ALC60_01849 [Trachymyrmex zeteki]
MSTPNLQDMCPSAGGHMDSPKFEDIREDLLRFMLQGASRDSDMNLSEDEIAEVDMVDSLKRGHPTTDDDIPGNIQLAKPSRDSKKARSRQSESRIPVKGAYKMAVDPEINNSKDRKVVKNSSGSAITDKRLKYDAFSRSPYIVMLRARSENVPNKKKMSLIKISGI